jgi:hypothetical protein
MTVSGIDVASYQGTTYNTTGLSFVLAKATEGTGYVNPNHAGQVLTARSRELVVGHYHFVRPGSMTAQVDYFLAHTAPHAGDLLALDWEDTGVSGADKDAFLRYLETKTPHNRVILYCNRDFWLNRDHTSYCAEGLWIADPNSAAGHPNIQHSWTIHQYSETGGIDHNVANFGSTDAMRSWAAKGVIAPPPHPHPTASYVPFPGSAWFHLGRKDPIVQEMHKRLVAEGCNHYQSSRNQDVIGSGDVASYEAWQRKCGYHGKAATWPPGKTTWDKLKVPRS